MKPSIAIVVSLMLLGFLTPAATPPEPDLLRPAPDEPARFTILSRAQTPGQARYVLRSETGIFRCQLVLTNTAITNLTIVISGQRFCEGLDFKPAQGTWRTLKSSPGVAIRPDAGTNMVLEFSAPALEKMQPGSLLQFINQYR
jgi:hypothetical protein